MEQLLAAGHLLTAAAAAPLPDLVLHRPCLLPLTLDTAATAAHTQQQQQPRASWRRHHNGQKRVGLVHPLHHLLHS